MCCTCSVSLHTVQFCVCLRLCVCLPACVSVSTCKVSTFLLSFVCLCVCLLVCVCACVRVRAEASSTVSHSGASGTEHWTLTDISVLFWPYQGLLCLGHTAWKTCLSLSAYLLISSSYCFLFFLLVNEIDALINALINYSLERWNILRRWPVECDKWATDSELCPRQQNHCDIPVWKKYLQGCSAI